MEALKVKGNELFAAGQFEEAISKYSEALALEDDAILYSNLSAAHLKAGHVDQALQSAEKCIELKPDWEKGHMRRDLALKAKGTTKVKQAPASSMSDTKKHGTRTKAVRIRAGPFSTKEELAALIEPYEFSGHGNEAKETAQLQREMGWVGKTGEAKWYGPDECQWYFFAYTQPRGPGMVGPRNKAMQLACPQGGAIHNDVFCVKSGPMHVVQRPDWTDYMTLEQVVDSIWYYRGKDPSKVFAERECKRVFGGAHGDYIGSSKMNGKNVSYTVS